MNFLCIYSGEGKGGGGGRGSLMLVYVWEHIAFPTKQIDGYWPNFLGMK